MKPTRLFVAQSILSLGMVAAPVWADTTNITVINPSFEMTSTPLPLAFSCGTGCSYNDGPIPGWTLAGGEQGSFQPSSTYFTLPLPDGSIVAYSNGGTISQTLAASLTPDTTYTLSVDVGRRFDANVNNYTLALYVDGTLLESLTASNGLIQPGTFLDQSLNYTSGAVPPTGNLEIVLSAVGPQQVDFDNVRLTASTVPEPSSLSLLAGALAVVFLALRRR